MSDAFALAQEQRVKMCVLNDGNERRIYCQSPEAAEVCTLVPLNLAHVFFNTMFNSGFWND